MVHRYRVESLRSRPPEMILAFQTPVFMPTVQSRPVDCRCTWAPRFIPVTRRPGGPSDPRPPVRSWQVDGFLLKFRDVDCPSRRRHG